MGGIKRQHHSDTSDSDKETGQQNVTTQLVLKQLTKLKETKAPGPDNLYPRVLKELSEEIAEPLQIIFNKSMSTGLIPNEWKRANVTPIFKKGDKGLSENYRPVSLTSVPCKMLESIIKAQITDYITEKNLIRNTQHGFVQGRSCLTNLLEFMEYV